VTRLTPCLLTGDDPELGLLLTLGYILYRTQFAPPPSILLRVLGGSFWSRRCSCASVRFSTSGDIMPCFLSSVVASRSTNGVRAWTQFGWNGGPPLMAESGG